jgi:hypothetical protein
MQKVKGKKVVIENNRLDDFCIFGELLHFTFCILN